MLALSRVQASLIAQLETNPPAMQEIPVQFLGREDPLEQGKATHSSILAWKIPWLSDFHFTSAFKVLILPIYIHNKTIHFLIIWLQILPLIYVVLFIIETIQMEENNLYNNSHLKMWGNKSACKWVLYETEAYYFLFWSFLLLLSNFFNLMLILVSQVAQWLRISLPSRRCKFSSWVGKIPWRRKWQSTPVFLPGKSLWTVAHQAPLSMGFSGQEYWTWLPFPSSRDLPNPRITPSILVSPTLAGKFFTIVSPRKTKIFVKEDWIK